MYIPDIRQIHTEHREALMLCDDIEHFIQHMDEQNNYMNFLDSIESLLDLLINVHYPHEQQMMHQIRSHDPLMLQNTCPEDRHVNAIASLRYLDELVNAAMNGTLVAKLDIKSQAINAVANLAHLIDIEENICLAKRNSVNTGEHHEA